jgi:lysophospholipase L1-like esterase
MHRLVAAATATTAARSNAIYVNLFQERDDDPFVRQAELNASDGLHPSDAGYRVWWQVLQDQADLSGRLQGKAPSP